MPSILFTFEVSKLERLIDANKEQPKNILLISIIFEVLKRGLNEIEIILSISLNSAFKELGYFSISNNIYTSWSCVSLNK